MVRVEDENGNLLYDIEDNVRPVYSIPSFYSNGGRVRVVFEYTGSAAVSSFWLENFVMYQYGIGLAMDLPPVATVGDTVMLRLSSYLQNNDVPDYTSVWVYDTPNYNNYQPLHPYFDSGAVSVVAQSDTALLLVWNSVGSFEVSANVIKDGVYADWPAQAGCREFINVLANPIYLEDSIYYTSAAKDTVIGSHRQLHNAVLPASVRVVKDSAFFDRGNLAAVSLPDGLEYIGKMAFAWGYALTEVTIPQGVKFIGDNAFWSCANLTTVNFNADSCLVASPTTGSDGSYWPVFIDCDNVRTINIGENVKRIPDRLFSFCNGLRGTLTIPDAVTYIGANAFYHWDESNTDSLAIVIGSSVSYIGNYALECHDHISTVTARCLVPPTIGEATFMVYPHYLLTVPCGTRDAYMGHQYWREFDTYGRGVEEDCTGIEEAPQADAVSVYGVQGGIVVDGAPGEPVAVYDVMGRRVLAAVAGGTTMSVPQAGVYMVKVGDRPACKVVVLR
jgi:hypothetical protein